ncbi:MAG TPA: DUF1573 domain-containing protein [Candidatus Hydrogenedentes bacterium]|nr:DUF1573 domain-containing protein [Candidatus Hydrogenedentota bacterium]HPG69516.1 DUF1573 domain-containing protein [Candidatus Hydrogenedentota bacterium]
MRARPGQLIGVAAILAVGGALVVLFQGPGHRATESEEEFIQKVRQIQSSAPESELPGQLPPQGTDASLVPRIELEPVELSVGPLSNETKSTFDVAVHNRGRAILQITSVQTNCACTQGAMENKEVPPGQSGLLSIVIDPFRIFGFVADKELTIYTNDPKNGAVRLPVHCTIEPEFGLEPESLEFGFVEKGESKALVLVVRQLTDQPVEVTDVTAVGADGILDLSLVKRPETEWAAPGKPEFAITAALAADLPPGEYQDAVKIGLKCKRMPHTLVRAHATLNSFYSVSPKKLILSRHVAEEYAQATIVAQKAFTIVQVVAGDPHLDFTVETGQAENTAILRPTVRPDTPVGDYATDVRFVIEAGDQRLENRIPVHFVVN